MTEEILVSSADDATYNLDFFPFRYHSTFVLPHGV